jgi:glycosyltransferase involved in cell wall biosynthesis
MPESVDYFDTVVKPLIDDHHIKYVGPVDMEQKIDLLSHARGLLNPIMWNEPFGMVMIEAMALGCPVIAFARGAAGELVVHKKTGFLVKDVEEMASFIPRIEHLDRAVARTHVEQNFSVRAMAEHYTRVYKKVAATAAARGMQTAVAAKTRLARLSPPPTHTHAPLKIDAPVPAQLPTSHSARATVEAEPFS